MPGPVNTGLRVSSYSYGTQPVPIVTLRGTPALQAGLGEYGVVPSPLQPPVLVGGQGQS